MDDHGPKTGFQTSEPAFKPGYTGYVPGIGPRRRYQFGKTFGAMTHKLLESHPVAGLRLASIDDCSQTLQENFEKEVLTWRHEIASQNNKLNRTMVSGYSGYIPRRKYVCGKTFDEESKEAIALIEKLKLLNEK